MRRTTIDRDDLDNVIVGPWAPRPTIDRRTLDEALAPYGGPSNVERERLRAEFAKPHAGPTSFSVIDRIRDAFKAARRRIAYGK